MKKIDSNFIQYLQKNQKDIFWQQIFSTPHDILSHKSEVVRIDFEKTKIQLRNILSTNLNKFLKQQAHLKKLETELKDLSESKIDVVNYLQITPKQIQVVQNYEQSLKQNRDKFKTLINQKDELKKLLNIPEQIKDFLKRKRYQDGLKLLIKLKKIQTYLQRNPTKKNITELFNQKFQTLNQNILNFLFHKKQFSEKEKILDFLYKLLTYEEFQNPALLQELSTKLIQMNLQHFIKSKKIPKKEPNYKIKISLKYLETFSQTQKDFSTILEYNQSLVKPCSQIFKIFLVKIQKIILKFLTTNEKEEMELNFLRFLKNEQMTSDFEKEDFQKQLFSSQNLFKKIIDTVTKQNFEKITKKFVKKFGCQLRNQLIQTGNITFLEEVENLHPLILDLARKSFSDEIPAEVEIPESEPIQEQEETRDQPEDEDENPTENDQEKIVEDEPKIEEPKLSGQESWLKLTYALSQQQNSKLMKNFFNNLIAMVIIFFQSCESQDQFPIIQNLLELQIEKCCQDVTALFHKMVKFQLPECENLTQEVQESSVKKFGFIGRKILKILFYSLDVAQ